LDHAGRRRRDGGPETDFPYTAERELDERPSTVSRLLSCESQAEAHQHHPADRDRRAEAGQGLEQGPKQNAMMTTWTRHGFKAKGSATTGFADRS